jgi:hypothetical protein
MTNRVLLFGTILILAFAPAVVAADITGKWKGPMQGPNGSMEITFTFQVAGDKITGTVVGENGGEGKIESGTLKGDELAFVVVAGDGGFKVDFKGKVAGDEMKLTMAMGDMGDLQVTAKRVP